MDRSPSLPLSIYLFLSIELNKFFSICPPPSPWNRLSLVSLYLEFNRLLHRKIDPKVLPTGGVEISNLIVLLALWVKMANWHDYRRLIKRKEKVDTSIEF